MGDTHEISDAELADTFHQMYQKRRYNSLLFIIETCKAASMLHFIYSPNVIGFAAARVDEDSYSHHSDHTIGVHVIDRFSHYMLEFLERVDAHSSVTLGQFFGCCPYAKCHSHTVARTDLYIPPMTNEDKDAKKLKVTDFFSSVRLAEILPVNNPTTNISRSFHPRMFAEYEEYLKNPEIQLSDKKPGRKNQYVNQMVDKLKEYDTEKKEAKRRAGIEEQVNMMERKNTDEGVWFAVIIMVGLILYIVTSAYEIRSRDKKATIDFIPANWLPATCFSPNQWRFRKTKACFKTDLKIKLVPNIVVPYLN